MSKVLRIALTASLFFLAATQVQATLMTWRLENVNFDDGGTAVGFFQYDPTTPPCGGSAACMGVVPDFNITTSPGFAFPNEYTPQDDGGRGFIVFAAPTGIVIGGDSGAGGTRLIFLFDEVLPPLGGTVQLASGSLEDFVDVLSEIVTTGQREIISGSVVGTTIPEPGSWALVAVGGALLMLLRRRK